MGIIDRQGSKVKHPRLYGSAREGNKKPANAGSANPGHMLSAEHAKRQQRAAYQAGIRVKRGGHNETVHIIKHGG